MSRSGVLTTEVITLRVVFENEMGSLVDPDAVPELYIYDPSFSEDDIEAEVDTQVYTGLGPFASTQISTGYYEYSYTVPSGADPGTYYDLWLSERDGTVSHEIFSFVVIEETQLSLQSITSNQLIVVELDSSIADLDGNTLGSDVTITYSTVYDPLYASPDLVRAEVGSWIDFVPNDTLNLLIHWSSKEVDQVGPVAVKRLETLPYEDYVMQFENSKSRNMGMFRLARTKFVIYDTAWRVLMLPGAANASNVTGAGQLKRLGDLTIQGPSNAGFGSSGLTMEQMNEIKKKRDEWWRVVNAGGTIVPGQGLDPTFALKGLVNPDRRRSGRQWDDPGLYRYAQPTVNTKVRRLGRTNRRFFFRDR